VIFTKPAGRSRRYFTEYFEVNVESVFSCYVPKYYRFYARQSGNNCLLKFCKTKQAWFSPLYPVILPILASEKEQIVDY